MVITKKFSFDAAHRLHTVGTKHPCRCFHGHRYDVIVSIGIEGLGSDNMVVDYHDLIVIKNYLNKNFDHATLVSTADIELRDLIDSFPLIFGKVLLLPIMDITAEHLSTYLRDAFCELLVDRIEDYTEEERLQRMSLSVAVSETPNTSACSDSIPLRMPRG